MAEKIVFPNFRVSPKLEIKESPISNIFYDWFSKQFCPLNFSYQSGLPILDDGIKSNISMKG